MSWIKPLKRRPQSTAYSMGIGYHNRKCPICSAPLTGWRAVFCSARCRKRHQRKLDNPTSTSSSVTASPGEPHVTVPAVKRSSSGSTKLSQSELDNPTSTSSSVRKPWICGGCGKASNPTFNTVNRDAVCPICGVTHQFQGSLDVETASPGEPHVTVPAVKRSSSGSTKLSQSGSTKLSQIAREKMEAVIAERWRKIDAMRKGGRDGTDQL